MFFKKIHLPLRFIQLPFQAFSVYWCFLNSQLLWVTTFLMTLLSALQVMHSLRMACILSKFFNYRPPRWKNVEHVGPSIHQSAHVNMNAHIFSTRMGQTGGSAGVKDKEREAHHACLPFLSAELSEFCCVSSSVCDMNIHEVILSLVKASCCSTEGSG